MDTQTPPPPTTAAELLTSSPGAVVVAILNLDAAAKLLALAMGYAGAPLVLKSKGARAVNSTSTTKKQKGMLKWDRKILDVLQSQPCGTATCAKIAQLLGAPRNTISSALTDMYDLKLLTRQKIDGLYLYKAAASPDRPALEVSKPEPAEAFPTLRHRILAFLKANKGKGLYTNSEIAKKLKTDTATVSPRMTWLFKAGCVARIKDEYGIFAYEFVKDLTIFRQNTQKGGQA